MILNGFILLVALLHLYFLIIEMFLWTKPYGMKNFKTTKEFAQSSAVLAANQGLYNGFLAAGLLVGFLCDEPIRQAFHLYFLSCVIVAGFYGAYSANKKIFLRTY